MPIEGFSYLFPGSHPIPLGLATLNDFGVNEGAIILLDFHSSSTHLLVPHMSSSLDELFSAAAASPNQNAVQAAVFITVAKAGQDPAITYYTGQIFYTPGKKVRHELPDGGGSTQFIPAFFASQDGSISNAEGEMDALVLTITAPSVFEPGGKYAVQVTALGGGVNVNEEFVPNSIQAGESCVITGDAPLAIVVGPLGS